MPPLDNTYSLRTRGDGTIPQPSPEDQASYAWTGMLSEPEEAPVGSTIISVADDGSVTVTEKKPEKPPRNENFDENLAERVELYSALGEIAADILDGVDSDLASRQGWISNYTEGLDLLGLKIDQRSNTKGQKRNVSRVRDTTLLETIVKAQSQARGEMLPSAGPAKVQELPNSSTTDDALAGDFEADFNFALTKGMPEYVPDLDRGLFSFFYGGNMFRYGYICPIRGRPTVSTIANEDLIVSEEATDLDTATRVTHRIPAMSPGEVKRRQYYGLWRDIDLNGTMPDITPEKQKLADIAGIRNMSMRPKDQPLCIYATITDLDLKMYGLDEPNAPHGLPLPYKVTIERYSRQVLRIERYWKDGDPRFQRKRRLIHYSMVPGFGFLAYGFLHLQGNQVKALTAIVRLLIDAMMFANFPGGAKAKGARTETNELEPGPGEWVEIGVPGGIDDIRKVLMAFPYKDLSPVAIQFYGLLQQAAARLGSAAMLEVGEGRANIPVGTVMAMLEEKSIVMSSIHKRMHAAMSQELSMLRELFMERPETLAMVCPNPHRQWAVAEEFADLNLVPASDPNVPSQVHRIMLATALATLLQMPTVSPLLDTVDVLKRILRIIGISDVDSTIKSPVANAAPPPPDPAVVTAQSNLQAKQLDVQAKAQENQRKAADEAVDAQQKSTQAAQDAVDAREDRASQERIAQMREETERMRLLAEEARANATLAHEGQKASLEHSREVDAMTHEHLNNAASLAHEQIKTHLDNLGSAADREKDKEIAAMQPRNFGGDTL